MVTRYFIVLLLSGFTALCCFPAPSQAQQSSHAYDSMAVQVLSYVNEHRAGMGLKPLKMNEVISAAARNHTRDMATSKIPFGHKGFNDRTEQLSKQIKPSFSFAENVAEGPDNAKAVVDFWLNSPGHKKNIEGDYNLTGIGIVKAKDGTFYYTQIFIKKGE